MYNGHSPSATTSANTMSSYEYASYPPPSYDPNQQRNIRPGPPHPHPHPPPPPNAYSVPPPHQAPYPYPPYGQPSYPMPPSQWPGHPPPQWSGYPGPMPVAPIQHHPAAPPPPTAAAAAATAQQQPPPPPTSSMSVDSAHGPSSSGVPTAGEAQRTRTSPMTDNKRQQHQPIAPVNPPQAQPPPARPPPEGMLDFARLLDTYRTVLDVGYGYHTAPIDSKPPAFQTIERMIQSAQTGLQLLETALEGPTTQASAPPSSPQRKDHKPKFDKSVSKKNKDAEREKNIIAATQQMNEGTLPPPPANGEQQCLGCFATSTPEWRRGPLGPRTLCNACGLVYAKLIKKRSKNAQMAVQNNANGSTAEEGESTGASADEYN